MMEPESPTWTETEFHYIKTEKQSPETEAKCQKIVTVVHDRPKIHLFQAPLWQLAVVMINHIAVGVFP